MVGIETAPCGPAHRLVLRKEIIHRKFKAAEQLEAFESWVTARVTGICKDVQAAVHFLQEF